MYFFEVPAFFVALYLSNQLNFASGIFYETEVNWGTW